MIKEKTSFSKLISIFAYLATICIILFLSSNMAHAQGKFPGSVQYTVKSGDTLYFIASRNGISLDVLRTVNGLTSDLIMPGQVLNIPANTGKIFTRYTILPGDSLYTISQKFGVPVYNIKYANNMSSDTIISYEVLTIPYLSQKPLSTILGNKGINPSTAKIDIVVDKSEHTLMLFSRGTWLKTYHVEIGSASLADKQVSGDKKTPEGRFYICEESVFKPADQYLGTRWMRLSYPNSEDAYRGLINGLIDQATYNAIVAAINKGAIPPQNTVLGEGIGIHGGNSPAQGVDWTWGCIGLTSNDAEEIFNYVAVGTQVFVEK